VPFLFPAKPSSFQCSVSLIIQIEENAQRLIASEELAKMGAPEAVALVCYFSV